MRSCRGPEGDERVWFDADEIEQIMEDELHRAGLWSALQSEPIDVEAFIESHLKASLDQHADLDPGVLAAAHGLLTREGGLDGATRQLAQRFEVSRETASIRLTTFGSLQPEAGSEFFG
jgi:hypothetical protein